MKAAKVAKRVMKRNYAVIIDDKWSAKQWISDGINAYMADESVKYTEENLMGILDIDPEKRDKVEVTERFVEGDLFAMVETDRDKPLQPIGSIVYSGECMTCMRTEDERRIWVRQSYIEPADGKMGLRFFLRDEHIACFANLFCSAVLTPESEEEQEKIEDILRAMLGETTNEELQRRAEEAESRAEREHERAQAAVRRAVMAENRKDMEDENDADQ